VTNPYCRFAEPYRTDFRGLATYTVPKADVQVALTWISVPGEYLEANFVADNAWIAAGPQPLGRPLTGAAVVTVNLIPPYTMFADRRNNIDFRVAKVRGEAGPGWGRLLQPAEHGRGYGLQPDVRAGWPVADSNGPAAGAIRQVKYGD
jgi:hypothetical protein